MWPVELSELVWNFCHGLRLLVLCCCAPLLQHFLSQPECPLSDTWRWFLSMWMLVQNQPLPQVFSRWVICERRARSLRRFWSCERDVCARADLTWCPRNALSFWLFFLTQISSKYGLGLNKFVFLELRRLQKKFWLQLTVVARGERRRRTT